MLLLLYKIQIFLKSSLFIELIKIFSLLGIVTFIMILIVYPIFLNIVFKIREKNGRDI